jgi:hypothetical protein
MRTKSAVLVMLAAAGLALLSSCGAKRQAGGPYADPHPGVVAVKYYQLPVGAVKPRGWLATTMRISGEGITGHLHEYRPDSFWRTWDDRAYRGKLELEKSGNLSHEVWWPYEQQAYWADGLVQLAYIIGDPRLKSIADEFVTKALSGQTSDGYIGGWPNHPYTKTDDGDIYVQGHLLRALVSYYNATQDPRIVPAVQKALQHIYANCKPIPDKDGRLPSAWWAGSAKWPIASQIIYACLWVYSKTGDEQALDLATLAYKATQEGARNTGIDDGPSDIRLKSLLSDADDLYTMHGVDLTLLLRIPANHYVFSGDPDELRASIKGIEKVDKFHGHVHGAPAADEPLGEPTALAGTETCDTAEYSLTKETLFAITGDVKYVDGVEKMVFNTLPGASRTDGKATQYYSYVNTIAQTYLPDADPGVLCCVGEWCRVYPNYVSKAMWLASQDGGLAAVGYGPSTVSATVGAEGKTVSFTESTRYPFEEKVRLAVTSPGSIKFPLYVRIPGWCNEARLEVNGKPQGETPLPGTMVKLDRAWSEGDTVDIYLPMHVQLPRWDKWSVAVERGPLVYALKIKEDWRVSKERFPGFPDWEVLAASPWNYALCFRLYGAGMISRRRLDDETSENHMGDSYFKVSYNNVPEDANPWENPPVQLIAKAKRVDSWRLKSALPAVLPLNNDRAEALTPDVPQSPVITSNPQEDVTLVPYGCTHVRVTYFPVTPIPEHRAAGAGAAK